IDARFDGDRVQRVDIAQSVEENRNVALNDNSNRHGYGAVASIRRGGLVLFRPSRAGSKERDGDDDQEDDADADRNISISLQAGLARFREAYLARGSGIGDIPLDDALRHPAAPPAAGSNV